MEIGEAIAIGLIQPVLEKCPFNEQGKDVAVEDEDVKNDDRDSADTLQDNNGGTLGRNLIKGSPDGWGASGTLNDLYPPFETISPKPRVDSKTNPALSVNVDGEQYPFKVAAHHLIPGDASLTQSKLWKSYMIDRAQVTTPAGRSYTIKANIGYNVNGNHNGVWLPGNYGIRKGTSKKELSWAELGADPWCFRYMLASVQKTGGQFHDAHTKYNAAVLKILNKVHVLIMAHQDTCQECAHKKDIYPPYMLKARLYLFARYLRSKLTKPPGKWRIPWFTSDRFKDDMMRQQLLHE